jgi:transposase
MRFVGIDLHKRSLTVCVFDKVSGETFDRRFFCSEREAILGFFSDLGPFEAVMEATATYEWLWELLEPWAYRLVLAHPKKIRVIAESMKKTDKRDAFFLAWLLASDSVPEAHRPSPRQREYQHLVRHRCELVRSRTRVMVRVRSILAARNLDQKGLFTAKGRASIESLRLTAMERFRVGELLLTIDTYTESIKTATKALSNFRKAFSSEEKRFHEIVTSVPGIGDLVADVIHCTLGDIQRFQSAQKCTSYAGIVPGFRESDSKRKELGITKEGPRMLRWALVQASWRATKNSPRWRKVFEAIAKRRGRKKAVVAVARRLLAVVYTLLKKDELYREDLQKPVAPPPKIRSKMKLSA